MKSPYHETRWEALEAFKTAVTQAEAVLTLDEDAWTMEVYNRGHIAYGTTQCFDFAIQALKGKPTRKYFHVTIYRMDSGRYELTAYIL